MTVERRYAIALRGIEMAIWKGELASRLWRAQAVLRVTGQLTADFEQLQREVEQFTAVANWIAQRGTEG